jgi:RHS repeat-associated protein
MTSGNSHRFTGHERDDESGLDYMLARYHSSSLSRFTSADPVVRLSKNVVQPMRWNRYTYVLNNPLVAIDPDGRDTYRVNRRLGGDKASSQYNPLTHTFVATTDNGKVTDTYSWGNNGSPGKWHKNAPEDMKSAQEAIDTAKARKVGGESLDAAVDKAYEKKKNDPAHANLLIDNNCKEEADDLIDDAKKEEKKEEEKPEEKEKQQAAQPGTSPQTPEKRR